MALALHVIAVGRLKRGAMAELWDDYRGRLARRLKLTEIEAEQGPGAMAREGAHILAQSRDAGSLVALDEAGEILSSREFASRLSAIEDQGVRTLAFAIGGAEGLDRSVVESAAFSLSFGRLTWPHMLARVMLAEQLYRAEAILANHPYHRG